MSDLEALRRTILEDCDAVLALPRLVVSHARRVLVTAQRGFWSAASPETLQALADLLPALLSVSAPEASADDPVRAAALAAATSMQQRASLAALQHGMMPCAWLANTISLAITALPLLPES